MRGEGERKFLDLLEGWTRDGDFSGVGGISYLDKDRVYHQTDRLPRIREMCQRRHKYHFQSISEALGRTVEGAATHHPEGTKSLLRQRRPVEPNGGNGTAARKRQQPWRTKSGNIG